MHEKSWIEAILTVGDSRQTSWIEAILVRNPAFFAKKSGKTLIFHDFRPKNDRFGVLFACFAMDEAHFGHGSRPFWLPMDRAHFGMLWIEAILVWTHEPSHFRGAADLGHG